MKTSQWRGDLGALGLLGVAVGIFFWPAATLEGAFFVQDVMVQNYPFREFFARALEQGELPLWNPAINCGFPLFAEGQAGALYPPNLLLALVFPTYAALNLNIVLHLWLGGAGMYALLRSLGAVRTAALCAGLCYSLAGYMTVRAMSPNFIDVCAWLPFLFVLVDRSLSRRNWVYMLFFSLVTALQLLAGHPQAAVYGLVAVAAYIIYRIWADRVGIRVASGLVCAPVLGIALAAVQLWPTAELVQWSNRGLGLSWQHFIAMSLPPERLVTLLLPNFFGNSSHGTYWSREVGFFIQLCTYIGVLPLIFSWVALRERRDGHSGFFAALALVGMVLALGKYTAIFSLLYEVPGLSFFRIPTRFLLWFALGAAVLCGLGVDQIMRIDRHRRTSGWLLAGGLGIIVALSLYINGVDLFAIAPGARVELERYIHHLRIDILRFLIALGLGVWFLGRRARRVVAWVAPLAIWVELYSFGAEFNSTIEPEAYTRIPDTASAILADHNEPAPPRIISLVSEKNTPFDWHGGWAYDLESYRRYSETLRIYSGGLYGLANTLPGWSPLHLYGHGELARNYPILAPLASIDYLVQYRQSRKPSGALIFESDIVVSRFPESMPRAYLVGQFHREVDPARRLAYMTRDFSMRGEVVLEENLSERVGAGGMVEIERYENEEVVLELGEHTGGILVLSDTYYPGWKAFVDGVERQILKANHVFRAVVVPPRAKIVHFVYEPETFRYGLLVTLAAALLWCGLIVGLRGMPFPLVGNGPGTAGSRLKVWALQGVLIALLHAWATKSPEWSAWLERVQLGLGS